MTNKTSTSKKLLPTLVFISVLVVALCNPSREVYAADSCILFDTGFETGKLSGFKWIHTQPQVVSASAGHPVRAGKYSMRTYLNAYTSKVNHKNMVHYLSSATTPENASSAKLFHFDIGKEYWIGFSVYMPADWKQDTVGELIWQMQADPDPQDKLPDGSLNYRSPLLAIYLQEKSRSSTPVFNFSIKGDTRSATTNNSFTRSAGYNIPITQQNLGKWTDWVIHTKLDWRTANNPFTKVYMNGKLVVDDKGINASNDVKGHFITSGVYKWDWRVGTIGEVKERVFYHDEIKIGSACAGYNGVAPGGTATQPAPSPQPTPAPKPAPTPAPTPAPQPKPTPAPTLPTVKNLILNNGFESKTTSWNFYTNGSGTFQAIAPALKGYEGKNAGVVTINKVGNNMQLYQTGAQLSAKTKYRLSFLAYSSRAQDMTVYLHRHSSPYSNYGLAKTFNLTKGWQNFSVDFTTTGFTGTTSDTRLRFWFSSHAANGDVYYLDQVVLTKL